MKYFEKQKISGIAEDEHGNKVWYPWAVIGQGRIINDDTALDKIRNLNKKSRFGILFLVLALGLIPTWWNFTAIPVFAAWYLFELSKTTHGMPIANENASYNKFAKTLANSFSYGYLIALNLLFGGALVLLLFTPKEKIAGLETLPLILITIPFALHSGYVMLLKYKSRAGGMGR